MDISRLPNSSQLQPCELPAQGFVEYGVYPSLESAEWQARRLVQCNPHAEATVRKVADESPAENRHAVDFRLRR